jgi:uncharacterized protein YodC (DUF2158 family)
MLKAGEMVRAGGGRLMKIFGINNDVAECGWFDGRGVVHVREYDVDHLDPLWLSMEPKSLWPSPNDMPDEVAAALDEQAARKRQERRSTKPKASNKIKRRAA